MTASIPPEMNPQWRRWFNALPDEQKNDLLVAWEDADYSDVQSRNSNAGYARRSKLIDLSKAVGYSP